MMASTSKGFRARIRGLQEHEVARLDAWARNNCARHAMFLDRGTAVLVCLRDTRRTSASFARSLRAVLEKLVIPTDGLRGHWLHLISEAEACALCGGCGAAPAGGSPAPSARESEVRIVTLS